MKKIIIFCAITLFNLSCSAQTFQNIKFIYLNGSNSNTFKKENDFTQGINNVQKSVKKAFENSEFICRTLLKCGKYKIDENPEIFFWGYFSKYDLKQAEELLADTKSLSPFFAQYFRSSIVHNIHDILWIMRNQNMHNVINKLHERILCCKQNGEKVILAGHSAGAFVTYMYLLNKLKDFTTDNLTGENNGTVTCSDAIVASGMGYRLFNGKLIKNPDKESFENGYKNIDFFTKSECIPDNLILGVINFGSPQPLFYPDRLDLASDNDYIYQYNLLNFIHSNDIFLLTINFAEDTLSLPAKNNISRLSEYSGFVYTYMKEKSPSSFITAHYKYWKYPEKFANMVKSGYIEGYSNK